MGNQWTQVSDAQKWMNESRVVAEKLRQAQATAALWKRAAKEYRGFYQLAMDTAKRNQLKWHKAQATADRRLELLERLLSNKVIFAPSDCDCTSCELIREIEKELTNDRA
jgi:hypothetical protein